MTDQELHAIRARWETYQKHPIFDDEYANAQDCLYDMPVLLGHIEEQRRKIESLETMHGLSLKEQATFLWALCRYSSNPGSCALNLMRDIGKCPFDGECEEVGQWAWLPILEKRMPPETNR